MSEKRKQILDRIAKERARQESLPGSEYDQRHTHNDWISIAAMYLTRASNRKNIPTSKNDFNDSLIKAAAVILAALEYND